MRNLLLIILTSFYYTKACCQLTTHPLSDMLTKPRGNISQHNAEETDIKQKGKEAIWYFNFDRNATETIKYHVRGDSLLFIYLPGSINRLDIDNNGTSLISREDHLTKLVYTTPMLFLPETISYGDTLSATFAMAGKYCQKYKLSGNGLRTVACDAYGMIIENGRDTINNVLRIHCTETADISTTLPNLPDNKDKCLQKTGDTYLWIDQRTGLPIYKYDIIAYNGNTDGSPKIGHTTRFCFTTDGEQEKDNTHDCDKMHKNNIDRSTGNSSIDYNIVNENNAITIYYNLHETSDITVALCDVSGISYFNEKQTVPAGNGYSIQIDTSGLRRGSYIIYISANGNTNNCKINID